MKKVFLISVVIILHFTFNINHCEAQWEPDVRLTNASGNSYTSNNNAWCVAATGNFVHAVWHDYRDGNYEIYYKRSTDGGVIWGVDTRLTNNTAHSESSSIAISGLHVHVVWRDQCDSNAEIYYKRSTDGGVNWGANTRLTNNICESFYPSIAVSGNIVHIVWKDDRDGNDEIYYKRSTDGGINWGLDTRLTNNTAHSYFPSIAVSGSLVHVVWSDFRDSNNWEIYYKRSTDGGINWGADTRMTNTTTLSAFPSIAVSGNVVHLVWYDSPDGNAEIYYKRSTDGGMNWGANTRLTYNTESSYYPSIAVSGNIVHVVWRDERNGQTGEIYYKRSSDGGVTWGADTRLTNNTAYSSFPSIAVSGNLVHVVWCDGRDGYLQIYYKRNPTGNLVGIEKISTEIPSAFSLEQNYPNPFNPSTNIQFSIPNSGNVKLTVYNALGQEIQSLLNGSINAGTYSVQFNGKDLNSGFYFYKLELNTIDGKYNSDVKKLIMIK